VEQWVLISPVADRTRSWTDLKAPWRGSRLRHLGFFSNNKQNCTEIQHALAIAWTAEFGLEPHFYLKTNASAPADPALIEQITGECDAVITGSGDCGSCTAATVHDSIALRQAGLPVAMLTTESFAGLAHMQAHALGDDALDLILVSHPIGGLSQDDLGQRCAEALAMGRAWVQRLTTDLVAVQE
jgi:hypothetical protein